MNAQTGFKAAAMGVQTGNAGAVGQRGFSLVTTLLFMVAALMLGVSVLSVNVMQERVIGNTKDRDLAFQAAEAALRDAEQDIQASALPESSFTAACTKGLCLPPTQWATPVSNPVHDLFTPADWLVKSREYGNTTLAPKFPGLVEQPRYVIEWLGNKRLVGYGETLGVAKPEVGPNIYRITARAFGARLETVVILQSMYLKS